LLPQHFMDASAFTHRAYAWLFANLAGVGLYLVSSSALWPEPQDVGFPTGPGEAFYWLFMVAPVLLASLVGNVVVLVHLFRTCNRAPRARFGAWVLVALVWVAVNSYSTQRSMHDVTSKAENQRSNFVA